MISPPPIVIIAFRLVRPMKKVDPAELLSPLRELGMTDEEIAYALKRASGIIFGFGMELRARVVLESMNFQEVKSVDLPTHDIEAVKDGVTYFVEVKATRKSPTREYSAYKIAEMAMLDGPHMTLVMLPEPKLYLTEEVLSEPKRSLLHLLRQIRRGDLNAIKEAMGIAEGSIKTYEQLVLEFARRNGGEEVATYLTYLLHEDRRNLEAL